MGRKSAQSAQDKGRPQNGRPFDTRKRAKFLEKIKEGASLRAACRLSGVAKKTVGVWLKSGRNGGRDEHVEFARAYDEMIEIGTHENTKKLHASEDVRALIEIQRARDPRFGDLDLRRRKLLTEIRKSELEVRATEIRVQMQEILLEKARDGGAEDSLGFGYVQLLDAPELSESFKNELVAYMIAKRVVTVERAKLTELPAPADG